MLLKASNAKSFICVYIIISIPNTKPPNTQASFKAQNPLAIYTKSRK